MRRVLAVQSPLISQLDLIIVDDGSTDGTREVLRALTAKPSGPDHDRRVSREVTVEYLRWVNAFALGDL